MTVPCSFSYPPEYHTENLGLFWRLFRRSPIKTYDWDTNAFIYHPNSTFVVKKYQGKTSMVPRKNNRSCTLKIKNLLDNRLHIYFQIVAEKSFSFSRQSVTITASGEQFVKISSSFQIAVVLLSTFHNTTSLVGPDAMPGTFNPGNSPVFDLDYGRCNQIVLLW